MLAMLDTTSNQNNSKTCNKPHSNLQASNPAMHADDDKRSKAFTTFFLKLLLKVIPTILSHSTKQLATQCFTIAYIKTCTQITNAACYIPTQLDNKCCYIPTQLDNKCCYIPIQLDNKCCYIHMHHDNVIHFTFKKSELNIKLVDCLLHDLPFLFNGYTMCFDKYLQEGKNTTNYSSSYCITTNSIGKAAV